MANISAYLQAIMAAVYGEEVRGSIHDAIDIINKVGEKTITLGTAVTSSSSSRTGYYDNSLYLNTNTWDLWKCGSSAWNLEGNLKGGSIGSITKTGTSGLVDTYRVDLDSGQSVGTFTVTNGERVNGSKSGNTVTITITHADGTTSSVSLKDGAKIGIGTGVTATNTSSTVDGVVYYSGDIYINNSTWHVWHRGSSSWTDEGSIIGPRGYSARFYVGPDTELDHKRDPNTNYNNTIFPLLASYILPSTDIQVGDLVQYVKEEDGTVYISIWTVSRVYTDAPVAIEVVNTGFYQASKGDTGETGFSTRINISSTHFYGDQVSCSLHTTDLSPNSNVKVGDIVLDIWTQAAPDLNHPTYNIGDTHVIVLRATSVAPEDDPVNPNLVNLVVAASSDIKRGDSITSIGFVSKVDRTTTYQVNLSNGTSAGTFEVQDGATGPTGPQGTPGVSPTVTTSKVGKVTTVTITDASGPHTFEVRDGADGSGVGDMLKATYDQDDDGIVDMAKEVSDVMTSSDLTAIINGRSGS